MEARIARLESDVAHVLAHVADIKIDLRSLRDKTDSSYIKAFALCAALAAAMLGTMARGFGWI